MEFSDLTKKYGSTNALPSSAEAIELKKALAVAEASLRSLDYAIGHAKDWPDSLLAERQGIVTRIRLCRIALAPHKRLPSEILTSIFLSACPEPATLPPRLKEPRLVLVQICSFWRSVAIDTPGLWCDILLCPARYPDPDREVALAKAWLARSADSLLTLQSSPSSRFPPTYVKWTLDPVQDIILPYSDRFTKLHLRLPSQQVQALLGLPSGSLRALKDLVLVADDFAWFWGPITVFKETPELREVVLEGFGDMDPRLFKFRWGQLTKIHLNLTWGKPDILHEVLSSCTSLTNCHLTVPLIDHTMAEQLNGLPTTSLPVLSRLYLNFENTQNYAAFIKPLVLPSLRDLELHCVSQLIWSQSCYQTLMDRSCCTLERLQIKDVTGNWSDKLFSEFLQTSPYLLDLHLPSEAHLDTTTMESIASGVALPRIKYLKFKVLQLEPALKMLELRQENATRSSQDGGVFEISKLAVVTIFCPPPSAGQVSRLQDLGDAGLRIRVSVPEHR